MVKFSDIVTNFLLAGLLRVGVGRSAWKLEQHIIDFWSILLFFADQRLRKMRRKIVIFLHNVILLLFIFIYLKRFCVWTQHTILP